MSDTKQKEVMMSEFGESSKTRQEIEEEEDEPSQPRQEFEEQPSNEEEEDESEPSRTRHFASMTPITDFGFLYQYRSNECCFHVTFNEPQGAGGETVQERWFRGFQDVLDKIVLGDNDGTSLVVLINFISNITSKKINFTRKSVTLSRSQKSELIDALDVSIADSKRKYPNLLITQVFVGTMLDHLQCHWKGRGKSFISLNKAHRKLFKSLSYPQIVPNEFGGFALASVHLPHSGFVVIPHAMKKALQITCVQGQKITFVAYVVEDWDVTVTVEFIPVSSQSYPLLLERRGLIMMGDLPNQRLQKEFESPEDGSIYIVVENNSFSTKSLVYICELQ